MKSKDVSLKSAKCRWVGCTEKFEGPAQARAHEYEAHIANTREVQCKINGCGKSFASYQKLQRHFVAHKERQFVCDECGKKFLYSWDLKRHEFIHSGERPFRCEMEGCLRSFTKATNCELHMMNDHRQTKKAGRSPKRVRVQSSDEESDITEAVTSMASDKEDKESSYGADLEKSPGTPLPSLETANLLSRSSSVSSLPMVPETGISPVNRFTVGNQTVSPLLNRIRMPYVQPGQIPSAGMNLLYSPYLWPGTRSMPPGFDHLNAHMMQSSRYRMPASNMFYQIPAFSGFTS